MSIHLQNWFPVGITNHIGTILIFTPSRNVYISSSVQYFKRHINLLSASYTNSYFFSSSPKDPYISAWKFNILICKTHSSNLLTYARLKGNKFLSLGMSWLISLTRIKSKGYAIGFQCVRGTNNPCCGSKGCIASLLLGSVMNSEMTQRNYSIWKARSCSLWIAE